MNSQIGRFGLVAALCGVVLAGCNAVEDVRDEPYTAVPTPTVVLQGTITGLGSRRSLVLVNNGNNNAALSFQAAVPTKPSTGVTVTPFSFGAVPVGSAYAITVRQQPYGKQCDVHNGTGTITTAEALNVTISCVDNVPRYSITVTVADSFASAPGAKVTLTTEEAIFEKVPVPGTPTLVFPNAVFNATPGGVIQPVNTWTVTASTTEGGTVNKCIVQNPTNPSVAGVSQNPTADIGVGSATASFPTVGRTAGVTTGLSPCLFTISGTVSYSRPAIGVTTDPPMGAGGVTLELRDVQGQPAVVAPTPVTVTSFSSTAAANAFTLTTIGKSNSSGVYDVVVTRHPDGQRCVVGNSLVSTVANTNAVVGPNGASANLYVTGLTNPANITTLAVYCRNIPAAENQLKGTYRFTKRVLTTVTQPSGTPLPPITSATTTSTWLPFDLTVQNTASSNMLTFFDDGTFLYGTHSSSTQVEHGFYEYVPAAGAVLPKIRFSYTTDTNTSITAETGGLSYMPGRTTTTVTPVTPVTPNNTVALQHRSLVNVVRTVLPNGLHRITGTFGLLEGTNPTPAAPPANVAATAQPSRLDWELTEPQSANSEWTGTWISQDHRRFWVWDFATNYGTQVGVHGGAVSMNDACFTTEDLHAPSGLYTRRGSSTGCYPWNRPFTNQFYLISGAEAVDFASPNGLPGFIGRIPGGQTAFDGRSPSPLYFFVAPATTFAGITDQEIFPSPEPATTPSKTPYNSGGFPTWCTTEILGMRATLNGVPIDYPSYFCRTRAN